MEKLSEEITGESSDDDGTSLRQHSVQFVDHDVTTEILVRLPAKSLARFLCVSSLWASTIRSQDFIKSFMAQSSKRPRLLFALSTGPKFHRGINRYFSSAPQNPDQELYHVTNYDISPFQSSKVVQCVHGLICLKTNTRIVIYNPSTRRYVTLAGDNPQIQKDIRTGYGFFGYDPIEHKFKYLRVKLNAEEIHVITLGDQEWRRIHGCPPHYPESRGLCINGVLYYQARKDNTRSSVESRFIVSFDVRSEKFKLIEPPLPYNPLNLINYEGKLAITVKYYVSDYTIGISILEDAEKTEWSIKFFALRRLWRALIGGSTPVQVRAVHAGEVILASTKYFEPFCILYFNLRKRTFRRVVLEGIRYDNYLRWNQIGPISTIADHIENITFL